MIVLTRVRAALTRRVWECCALLALAIPLIAAPAAAQLSVSVSVAAPSPFLSDWGASGAVVQLVVTNSYGSDVQVTTHARLLRGQETVGLAASPITVIPGAGIVGAVPTPKVSVWTASQIAYWTQLQVGGSIAHAYTATQRLPEGEYQLCLQFTNVSLQGRALPDASGCTNFLISYPQPPMLVAPANGSSIAEVYPTFQWTPVVVPAGRPVGYLLRVVEVLPGQTPLKAIESNVPMFETVLSNVTTLTYAPTALPLETGKTYAWRVQAVSTGAGAAVATNFVAPSGPMVGVGENDGRSEVFTFSRRVLVATTHLPPVVPQGKPTYLFKVPLYDATLHGTLDYTYLPSQVPAPKRIQTYGGTLWPALRFTPSGLPNTSGAQPSTMHSLGSYGGHIIGVLGGGTQGFPAREPLGGVPLRLVVRYRSSTTPVTASEVVAGGTVYSDVDKVIATATTDSTGAFTFYFHDDTPTGQIATAQSISWGSGDVGQHYETGGNLFRFYQIEVEDGHYLNPSDELTLPQDRHGDAGTLVSLVRSYTLRVAVSGRQTNDVLQGARVRVVRFVRPEHLPDDEGDAPLPRALVGGRFLKGEVVAEGTADAQGMVTFHRLVKNVGPNDQYVVEASVDSTSDLNYDPGSVTYANAWGFLGNGGRAYDDANFNEAYDLTLTDTLKLQLQPRPPTLAGRVFRSDTKQAIGSGVVLVTRVGGTFALRNIKSGDDGRFVVAGVNEAPSSPFYSVVAGGPGFKVAEVDNIPIKLGRRWYHEFMLDPDARIRARFVDEKGNPVQASIRVGQGALIQAQPVRGRLLARATTSGRGQRFGGLMPTAYAVDTFATSGVQPVHIEAEPGYFPLDTTLTIAKGTSDLGTFVLTSRQHRIRVIVRRGGQAGRLRLPGLPDGQPVIGAPVRVALVDSVGGRTGRDGSVVLAWTSVGTGDSTVDIHVSSPPNEDYVAGGGTCAAPESRTPVNCVIGLEPGTRIAGKVYVGASDSTPLAGARVYLAEGGSETTSASDGAYVLHSVPIGAAIVRAAKAGSGLVADSQRVAPKGTPLSAVDFHLGDPKALKLPATLLGFQLEVDHADPSPDGKGAIVSGALVAPASGPVAPVSAGIVQKTLALPFEKVHLVAPSPGATLALPPGDSVVLTQGDLDLRLYDAYAVRQSALKTGLVVRPHGGGVGVVYGPARVRRQETFTGTTSTGLSFIDVAGQDAPLYLLVSGASGADRTLVPSLSGDGSNALPSAGLNVGSATGTAAHFRVAINSGQSGFPVDADPAKSVVRADGVHFDATVHTSIPGIGDLALQVPDLVLRPGSGGLAPAGSADTLTMELDQWTLRVNRWSLDATGIDLGSGEVDAPLAANDPSSTVVFPFTDMRLLPNTLTGGTFQGSAIQLGGVVALAPQGGLQFVREGGSGPWKIAASGGTIAGLPGFGAGDRVALDNWSLRSNGQNVFSPESGTKVRLFNTADFGVSAITVAKGVVRFPGTLDILAPAGSHIPQVLATIYYSRSPQGTPVFGMENATWPEVDIGGAFLKIADAQLDANGLHAGGYIRVPDNFTVATTFSRTPITGTNRITAVAAPNAAITVGEIGVSNVTGGATLGNAWTTHFAGHLEIPNQAKGDLSFDVNGTGVNVGAQGLQVKNIATPFGNLTIRIDLPDQQLQGSLQFDQDIAQGAHAQGTAQLAISGKPGDRFWYIFTGANISLSDPQLDGTAALLLGQKHLDGQLLSDFASYSTKGVPPAFYDISGFFMDGKVVIPIPICPSGGLDIGVASVDVWCDAWGDLRLGMNFQEHNTYHVGLQSGFDVGVSGGVSLGACVTVSALANYEQGVEGEYRSDGAWYVLGDANFQLTGNVTYGVGAFGACITDHATFTLGLGAEAQLGYDWNTQKGAHFLVYAK